MSSEADAHAQTAAGSEDATKIALAAITGCTASARMGGAAAR